LERRERPRGREEGGLHFLGRKGFGLRGTARKIEWSGRGAYLWTFGSCGAAYPVSRLGYVRS
jgi:hypothetical protein